MTSGSEVFSTNKPCDSNFQRGRNLRATFADVRNSLHPNEQTSFSNLNLIVIIIIIIIIKHLLMLLYVTVNNYVVIKNKIRIK